MSFLIPLDWSARSSAWESGSRGKEEEMKKESVRMCPSVASQILCWPDNKSENTGLTESYSFRNYMYFCTVLYFESL